MLFTLRRAGRAAWPTVALAFALTACAPLPPIASHVAAPSAIHRADGPLPVPPDLIALTQAGGQKRLISAAANQSYWPLSEYFETQRNEAYCSVATSVMALNALGIRRPESTQYPDFPYFSQEDFFRGVDPHVANADRVAKEGMTLDQLSAVLSEFPVDVEKFHSANLTLAQFRKLILDTTGRSDRFVLLNFRRVEIGEVGGGHWSPSQRSTSPAIVRSFSMLHDTSIRPCGFQ